MTEAYCSNAVVGANSPIPFNNVSIQKGCTSILSAPGTIQLNKKGVYMVDVNTSAIAGEAGSMNIELVKNGIKQPQASQSVTAADTTSTYPLSFSTLVQVSEDNTPCCCTSPTIVQILSSIPTTQSANIVVTKIC